MQLLISAVRLADHPAQVDRASAPAAGSADRASVATASLTTLLTTTLAALLVLLVLILIVLAHSILQMFCDLLFHSTNPLYISHNAAKARDVVKET